MGLKLAAALVLLVFTIVFGVWLSHSGKPLNMPLMTVHKVLGLLAVVFGVWVYVQWQRGITVGAFTLLMLIVTGVLAIVLFATGGMLSQDKPDMTAVLTVHRVVTLLALISTGLTLWSLKK